MLIQYVYDSGCGKKTLLPVVNKRTNILLSFRTHISVGNHQPDRKPLNSNLGDVISIM